MAKYRRKQTEIEAVQFVDGRFGEAIDFCPMLVVTFNVTPRARSIASAAIDKKTVNDTDWIVKDQTGACAVMTDAEFTSEYEAA